MKKFLVACLVAVAFAVAPHTSFAQTSVVEDEHFQPSTTDLTPGQHIIHGSGTEQDPYVVVTEGSASYDTLMNWGWTWDDDNYGPTHGPIWRGNVGYYYNLP